MTLVALLSLVLTIFLIYVLTTAVRLADREAIRAGWLGLAIIVVANGLSLLLYRSQAKVLDTAMTDLAEIIDGAGEPASGSGEDATD